MSNTWKISRPASSSAATHSALKDDNKGLKPLYPGQGTVVADVIAVHGLNGHRERTWSTTASRVNWLSSILPKEIPEVRILTYGYNSRTHATHGSEKLIAESLYEHGKTLLEQLHEFRRNTKTERRPIIFLTHSLGGIVVKSALIHSWIHQRDSQGEIKDSTYALIFFGTPHGGSSIASLGTKLLRLASPFTRTNIVIIRHLQEDSEYLRTQHDQFGPISSDFKIVNFYETYRTPITCGRGIIIVPKQSATRIGNHSISLRKSHTELVRFEDENDPDYQLVRGCIRDLVNNAPRSPTGTDITSPSGSRAPFVPPITMGGVLSSAASSEKPGSPESLVSAVAAPTSNMITLPFSLPVQQNPGFVGRENQLEQLHAHLCKSKNTPTGPSSPHHGVVVLFGIGGAGKTQLSLAFAEHHKKDFDVVFWIDASSERNTLTSFRTFAQRLLDSKTGEDARKSLLAKLNLWEYVSATGHVSSKDNDLPEVAKSVVEFLQSEDQTFTWLIVMDNWDDPNCPLSKYIPHSEQRGKIIITTRSTAITGLGKPIEIAEIDEESAIQILLNAAHMRIKTDTDLEDAKGIVQALGLLPLAIEQAGAYITKTQMQLSKYLVFWERHQHELLQSPKASSITGNQRSVCTTFEVSFERLDQDAAELLTLLSFLHNSVWEGLLSPVSDLGHRPQRQNSMPSSTQTPKTAENSSSLPRLYRNEVDMQEALGDIFSVSLAKRNIPDSTVYIHPLVHAWGRTRLSADAQHQKLVQAIVIVGRALETAYTRPITKEIRHFISRVVPHADQVISLVNEQGETVRDDIIFPALLKSPESARALFYLGVLFQNVSRLQEAESIFAAIIASKTGTDGILPPIICANTRRRLAQIMILYSRYAESDELLQAAIPVLEHHLGKRHEDTVTAMLELGMVYHRRHEYSRAETQLREAIKSGTNPITGRMGRAAREASSILGLVYRHMGRVKDALDVLTPALDQALAASKSTSSSSNSPTTDDKPPELIRANTLERQSSPKSARFISRRSQEIYDSEEDDQEEPDDQALAHLPTLQYRHAILLQELGLWTVAMTRYQAVYSSLSFILGLHNPLTLRTANALGRMYCFLGRYKDSREMLDLAWRGQQQLGFNKDVETAQLRTLFNIGVLNREEGLYEEAEDCLGRVGVAYKRLFGQSAPDNTGQATDADTIAQEPIPKLKFPVQNVMLENAITLTYMARHYPSSSPNTTSSAHYGSSAISGAHAFTSIKPPPKNMKQERLNKAVHILGYLLACQEKHDKISILEHVITRTALAEAYLEYHTPECLKEAEETILSAREYVTSEEAQLAGMEADNPLRLKVELVVVEILLESNKYMEAVEWMTKAEPQGGTAAEDAADMIARLEKAFGKEHQIVMRGKVLLAKGHYFTGKQDEAKSIVKEVVEILASTLGSQHPFTREVVRLARSWDPLAFPSADSARGDEDSDDEEGNAGVRKDRFGLRKKVMAMRQAF
ncbi:hypothetical protein V8F20_012231 [Naviculisporaceae sp. PSN 640]